MAILDQFGRPFERASLGEPQGGATVGGVRNPYAGMHPMAGLTPQRLARLLRDAACGDTESYLLLAEDMEERDLHYAGVLGTRKRQVANLEVTVTAASEAAKDVEAAGLVRGFVGRDVFQNELIDILDALGKGYSATEIIWDTSKTPWMPRELRWNDPRWFQLDWTDLTTLMLRSDAGYEPLRPFSWIVHFAKVKTGIPIRGGLARAVSWTLLFKHFTGKDWAIFCEAYGQPLRLGKFTQGASEEDRQTLLRAVQNIGADFGAIVPADMTIEFVQAAISGSLDLYERRSDWLDRQVSKIVLGQTQTTDATAGGYATAKVHDGVRGDIEEADARQLAATLNRDLVRAIIDLNYAPGTVGYPTITIGRPDDEDVTALIDNIVKVVPLGVRIGTAFVRDKLGAPEPGKGEEVMAQQPSAPTPPDSAGPAPLGEASRAAGSRIFAAARVLAETAPKEDAIDRGIADILDTGWEPMVRDLVSGLDLSQAETTEDVERALAEHLRTMDVSELAERLARAAFAAHLYGAGGLDPARK